MSKCRACLLLGSVLILAACGGSGGSGGSGGGDDGSDDSPIPDTGAPAVTAPYANNGTVLNILPPGQDDTGGLANADLPIPAGVLGQTAQETLAAVIGPVSEQTGLVPALDAEPHFKDQLGVYDALVHSQPGLTNEDLVPSYFKPEAMRGPNDGPWESERTKTVSSGDYEVDIKRGDEYGVPHIFGDTREAAMFGAGYVTAADRLFLVDVLRRAGRGELSQFLGPADLSFDRDIAFRAPYREADRKRQIEATAAKLGEVGDQMLRDLDAFVAGLNAYVNEVKQTTQPVDAATTKLPLEYLALGVSLEPFTRADVHAVATLIQSIFAGGGGGEADNLRLLYALQDQVQDAETACRLWRDIRHALDPASSVTTTRSFDTQSPRDYADDICPLKNDFATRFPGVAVFDQGSYQSHDFFSAVPCGRPSQASCPEPISGALPQLPATGGPLEGVQEALDSVLGELLGGLASNHEQGTDADSALARARARVPDAKLDAARRRVADLAEGFSQLAHGLPHEISNALLVGREAARGSNPIAVFGPQTSYFTPQLLLEMAVHGGDLHTRGMTFAGLPYVVIGRGTDFAWSATSGNSDLTDVRAVRTCAPMNPPDNRIEGRPAGYMVDGTCKPFDFIRQAWPARWNLAVPTDDPESVGQNLRVERNVIRTEEYGPVFAFAAVDGQPVALTRQRSTYGAELDTVTPFFLATRNDVHDAESFQRVFNTTTGSFNWFYIDKDDIAYIHAGRYPQRAPGVHPDLPAWGDGNHDWRGFIGFDRHPKAINPEKGFLDSWNNRPARDWWAADANASYGPSHRNEILDVRLRDLVAEGDVTRGKLVEAMGDAATVDLRGQEILPGVLRLLGSGELTSAEREAVDILRNWIDNGAMRRDRDNDGEYDTEAAVALMDAWYNPMIEAALPQITQVEDRMIMTRHNAPGPTGSAFQAGYYGYLERVIDMALDQAKHPYRELRCAGAGATKADCRAALRASLDQALTALGGINNRADWDADEAGDRIQHRPLGLAGVPPIDWQNRPTFQQVVEFNARR